MRVCWAWVGARVRARLALVARNPCVGNSYVSPFLTRTYSFYSNRKPYICYWYNSYNCLPCPRMNGMELTQKSAPFFFHTEV